MGTLKEFLSGIAADYDKEYQEKKAVQGQQQREQELLQAGAVQAWVDLAGFFQASCKLLNEDLKRDAFVFAQRGAKQFSLDLDVGIRFLSSFEEHYKSITFTSIEPKNTRQTFRIGVRDGSVVILGEVNGAMEPLTPEQIFERVIKQR